VSPGIRIPTFLSLASIVSVFLFLSSRCLGRANNGETYGSNEAGYVVPFVSLCPLPSLISAASTENNENPGSHSAHETALLYIYPPPLLSLSARRIFRRTASDFQLNVKCQSPFLTFITLLQIYFENKDFR
jgi:hypothetical protein